MGSMENTKAYIKHIVRIISWAIGLVSAVFSAFAFADPGRGIVQYYCTAGNPLFGIHLQTYAACPFYMAVIYIVSFTSMILVFIGLLAVVTDVAGLSFKRLTQKPIRYITNLLYRPKIEYALMKVYMGGEQVIELNITNPKRNHDAELKLEFSQFYAPKGNTHINAKIEALLPADKMIYSGRLYKGTTEHVRVAETREEGKELVLKVNSRLVKHLPSGEYLYLFYESGVYKNREFPRERKVFKIDFKDGEILVEKFYRSKR
jgi:hypothetical protein